MNFQFFTLKKTLLTCAAALLLFSCASTKEPEPEPTSPQAPQQQEEVSIHALILGGKSELTKEFFQSKVDINIPDKDGNTPLHACAQANDAQFAAYLILLGANIEAKNNDGKTPLFTAVEKKSKETIQTLIKNKADIFAANKDGQTVLEAALKLDPSYYDIFISKETAQFKNKAGQNIVHFFVLHQNLPAVQSCITKKLPISIEDADGNTPLALAYKNGNTISIEIAAALIQANAAPQRGEVAYFETAVKTRNPTMRFEDGQTPLHFAAIYGHEGIAEYFINQKAQINAKDISGATPLHQAVRKGNTAIIQKLLQAGANSEERDSFEKTALLIIPPIEKREEVYSVLLNSNAQTTVQDMYGDTILHLGTILELKPELLESFIKKGADCNVRNKLGVTPLALAVEAGLTEHVKLYIKYGADIHAEDVQKNTPLLRSFNTSLQMIKALVSDQNANALDSYGNNAIHIAVEKNAPVEYVEYFLTKGTEVNCRNLNGETPLFIAVKNNKQELGSLLLAKKADVFITTADNYSPLQLALERGGKISEWVLTSEVVIARDGFGNTPLHYAAEWKLEDAVLFLLEKGAAVNAKNSSGESALFNSIKVNSTKTAGILIDHNANCNERDYLGNTPLHSSVRWNSLDCAKLLINRKAEINAQNLAGKSPLGEAARQGKLSMVQLFIDKGADIDATDSTGKTVLMSAIQAQSMTIIELLLKHGAAADIQEMFGRNAFHEAAETHNIALITLIRSTGVNPLSRDLYGKTPFSVALQSKDIAIIQAVLGNNLTMTDSNGNTPVHLAIQERASADILQMLIDLKSPINRRNSQGISPLLLAVQMGLNAQSTVLIAAGADPFLADNEDNSAITLCLSNNQDILAIIAQKTGNKADLSGDGILHYAARYADEKTIQLLLDLGLDKTIKNISGETPKTVANRWKRYKIAEML